MALVTKKELAKKVASLVSLSERNCTAVINTLLELVAVELVDGNSVQLGGVGTLHIRVSEVPPRTRQSTAVSRHGQRGAVINVTVSRLTRVSCRKGSTLKRLIQAKYGKQKCEEVEHGQVRR